jgi:hypothetical protein
MEPTKWSRQYGLEKSKGLGSDDCNRCTGVVAGLGPRVVACICRALMEKHRRGCEHSLDSLCNNNRMCFVGAGGIYLIVEGVENCKKTLEAV